MVLVAAFVPFTHLDDMISAGILVAFSLTNSSLIILRCDSPEDRPGLMERYLAIYNALSFAFGFTIAHVQTLLGRGLTLVSSLGLLWYLIRLYCDCPQSSTFGGRNRIFSAPDGVSETTYFKTPFIPFIPCMGIFVNWYLVAQLEIEGIGLLLGYLGVVIIFYFLYSRHHSEDVDNASDSLLNYDISLQNIPPIA